MEEVSQVTVPDAARRVVAVTILAARALRILPGLWVCLIVTAFVIAPIGFRVLPMLIPFLAVEEVLGA